MSQWSPIWRIKIEGVEYTDVTLASMSISSGRTNIYEQAQASYCNLVLIKSDGSLIAPEINYGLTVEVQDSTAAYVPIFGGTISDIEVGIQSAGSVMFVQSIKIVATGALAKLNRTLTEGVLVKDFDGDQIYSILSDLFLNSWAEVPAAITWQAYQPATEQWQDAENTGLGEIDQPGDYELTARSASTTTVYALVSALATSGLGQLYEDAQGRIAYADSTHRGLYLATNGYKEILVGDAIYQGVKTVTRSGDVRNQITISYKNNQQKSAEDLDSVKEYGNLAQSISTSLENGVDAEDQAQFYLDLRAYPYAFFDQVTYELTNPMLSDAERDVLLEVFMGLPLRITDLPVNMGSQFEGYVEGWTFTSSFNKLQVNVLLSPVSFSTVAEKWLSVSVAEQWQTVSNTLEWQNAFIVA
jgi:hypothetical protein